MKSIFAILRLSVSPWAFSEVALILWWAQCWLSIVHYIEGQDQMLNMRWVRYYIHCTSFKPRKKRGTKNRYVQALRDELDDQSHNGLQGLETLAPPVIIKQIIADWFGWIHPVAPIVHQDCFTQQLADMQATTENASASFLLLVVSVCAVTVASLRRRRHLYSKVTVESCLNFAKCLRVWSLSTAISVERSIAMYNFGSALHHEHGIDSPLSYPLVTQAAMSVKFLIHQSLDTLSFMDQEILKRLYWLIYAGQCTSDVYGRQLLFLSQSHYQTTSFIPTKI